jgi:hypothetical protein
MRFSEWTKKHPEIVETGFLDKLKAKTRDWDALCKLNYTEEVWNRMMLPANERFVVEEEKKKIAREAAKEERKKAKAGL